jgi:hypothetical protein
MCIAIYSRDTVGLVTEEVKVHTHTREPDNNTWQRDVRLTFDLLLPHLSTADHLWIH